MVNSLFSFIFWPTHHHCREVLNFKCAQLARVMKDWEKLNKTNIQTIASTWITLGEYI